MFHTAVIRDSRICFGKACLDCQVMLPGIEEEVKRFYSELDIEVPVVRNPFIHSEQITSWTKKFEVRRKIQFVTLISSIIAN